MADGAPAPASAEDREVNIYMDLLNELAPVLIAISSAACFWCVFLTYRYIKARPSRKEIARKEIIARNARNRVRAVIGLNAMQNAFATGGGGDDSDEDLERPSVAEASKKQGAMQRAAAMSAFSAPKKNEPDAAALASAARLARKHQITHTVTLEHDGD